MNNYYSILTFCLFASLMGCRKDIAINDPKTPLGNTYNVVADSTDSSTVTTPINYSATKVVVIVIDGPRYSETFGEPSHAYIPRLDLMMHEGTLCTQLYNNGVTNTVNGHTALCTGNYESLDNFGLDVPTFPSYLQYWLEKSGKASNKAWVIASKDKLQVLANTTESSYNNRFMPLTDCGNSGLGSGYRDDSTTFRRVMETMRTEQPDLLLVNFKEPDWSGHQANWTAYLAGIRSTDEYAWQIWDFIQHDPYYKNQTELFITNDHGRHHDGNADGFVSHGDACYGCRHIAFLALGPDIKTNNVCRTVYDQIDITSSIASILNIKMGYNKGKYMKDIFNN